MQSKSVTDSDAEEGRPTSVSRKPQKGKEKRVPQEERSSIGQVQKIIDTASSQIIKTMAVLEKKGGSQDQAAHIRNDDYHCAMLIYTRLCSIPDSQEKIMFKNSLITSMMNFQAQAAVKASMQSRPYEANVHFPAQQIYPPSSSGYYPQSTPSTFVMPSYSAGYRGSGTMPVAVAGASGFSPAPARPDQFNPDIDLQVSQL